jgi:hypothetical protein
MRGHVGFESPATSQQLAEILTGHGRGRQGVLRHGPRRAKKLFWLAPADESGRGEHGSDTGSISP